MANNEEDLESEIESKLALEERSSERSHSTEHLDDDEPITEINVAPLVDVALCMVIIFMAVSPFMIQAGLTVSESRAGAAVGKASLEDNLQVTLNVNNQILVNGEAVLPEFLEKILKEKLPKTKDGLVTVQAEKENRVGQVVELMDIAKQAGAKKVALLNKAEDSKKTAEAEAAAKKLGKK